MRVKPSSRLATVMQKLQNHLILLVHISLATASWPSEVGRPRRQPGRL